MNWPGFRWGNRRSEADYEPPTDARRTEEMPPLDGQVDPERLRRRRLRRGAVLLCLGTFFVAGSLAALVGRGGYLDLRRKREEARRLRADVAILKVEVGVLGHTVKRLETEPWVKERIARERLGLVLPGEIDFLLPRERPGDLVE
jgi:cell division protein FtsB